MKKKIISIFLIISSLISLFSCGDNDIEYPDELHITDFPGYENLTRNPSKIEVTFDEGRRITFEITDPADIAEIVTLVFDKTIYRPAKSEGVAGDNIKLLFYDQNGEVSENLGAFGKRYHGKLYLRYDIGTDGENLRYALLKIGEKLGKIAK